MNADIGRQSDGPRTPVEVFPPDLLDNRVAVITGGGTGLGLATAQRLAGLGAHVVLLGRRHEVVDAAAQAIRDAGGAATSNAVDVRDYSTVADCFAEIAERRAGIDIVINNAAGNFRCATEELSANGWRSVIDIGLNGTFNCSRAAFQYLTVSPYIGRIVSVITTYGANGWPGCAPAAASKAGIQSLMRTLAVEWADRNILCNSVAPGVIGDTEGASRIHKNDSAGSSELDRIPLRRFGDKHDIATAIAYLVSPAGTYINGADLVVDGGRQFSFGRNNTHPRSG